ncbi:beta strand repeat-containing protein, partial [Campylobacter fetus]|uniref:beta strand repeat-containing protein n=1 Tax=Campylobacter fetus TaxID=196 RepID=UPI000A670DD1
TADLNSVNVGTATLSSLEANVNVSGEFKLGTTTAKGDIDFNIENVAALNLGAITSSTGNASVIISSATGAVTLGTVSATKGNVTLNAGNALGAVTLGNITGDIVSVDLGGVLGAINGTSGNKVSITSNEVVYVGSEISKNVVEITAVAGGTDLNAQMIGGANAADSLTLIGKADTQSITASGDLSGGTLALTLTEAIKLNSIDISGLKGIKGDVAINLSAAVQNNKTDVSVQGSDANEQITYAAPASLTEVKISGDLGAGVNSITITPDTAAATLTSIDLSGLSATGGTLTSTITLNAANTAANISIKGSLGGDTITVKGENKAVAIDLGKDTAVDTVNVSAVKIADKSTDSKIAEDLVSITNALSGDKITLTGVTAIANRGEITGDTLVAALAKLGEAGNGTVVAATAEVFVWNGNTYVVDTVGTSLANDDLIVKLTGIVTFSDTVDANTITVA